MLTSNTIVTLQLKLIKIIDEGNLAMKIPQGGSSSPLFPGRSKVGILVFCGGRKTGRPGEKMSEQGRLGGR